MPYTALDRTTAAVAAPTTLGAPLTSTGETLETMRGEVALILGDRSDVDPDRVERWINQAYLDLCSKLDLPELHRTLSVTTVSTNPLYLLPQKVFYTKQAALIDSSNYPSEGGIGLRKIDIETYRRLDEYSDVPDSWFYYNEMVVLHPTPNSSAKVIAIDAYIQPQKLVADDDSPILSEDWHEGIILGARAKGFDAMLEWDNAAQAQNAYVAFIRSKRDMKAAEKEGMIGQARPARSWRELRRLPPRTNQGDW